jgi:hypothetical protein
MDTYSHQKQPVSHAVANTPPNQAARWTGPALPLSTTERLAMRTKPAARKTRLKT